MSAVWNDPWLDHLRWILGNMQNLHLDSDEAIIALLIAYMNETHEDITHESLAAKSHLGVDTIEEIFTSLSDKGYLRVDFTDGILEFNQAGLMDNKSLAGTPLKRSLIEEFEEEFGRSLSSMEMQRILDLASRYNERRVIVALNEASSYDRRDLNYIENCLVSWKNKGYSIEDVENGKR